MDTNMVRLTVHLEHVIVFYMSMANLILMCFIKECDFQSD